jgi:hypothetical protein
MEKTPSKDSNLTKDEFMKILKRVARKTKPKKKKSKE